MYPVLLRPPIFIFVSPDGAFAAEAPPERVDSDVIEFIAFVLFCQLKYRSERANAAAQDCNLRLAPSHRRHLPVGVARVTSLEGGSIANQR